MAVRAHVPRNRRNFKSARPIIGPGRAAGPERAGGNGAGGNGGGALPPHDGSIASAMEPSLMMIGWQPNRE